MRTTFLLPILAVNSCKQRVIIEIFSIKFLTRDTILKPSNNVASGNKTEMKFVRNQFHYPRILKMIRWNKWFNTPALPYNWAKRKHFSGLVCNGISYIIYSMWTSASLYREAGDGLHKSQHLVPRTGKSTLWLCYYVNKIVCPFGTI